MYYIDLEGFEEEKFETYGEAGEWIIDHIYDLPQRTRIDIFYDLGGQFCLEEDTELEKGDYEYECRD